MESLPEGLGRLEKLEVLTASFNRIEIVPKGLFRVGSKIGVLQLNDNRIRRVSNEVGRLSKVKVLLLHNNRMVRVPSEIQQLKDLHEFSLEWFMYLNPPQSKVLKDERGQSFIQDFQKFCKASSDLAGRLPLQLSFVHFLSYFYKSPSIDSLSAYNAFPKHRLVAHYLCLHGHMHLLHSLLRECPGIDVNQVDLDGTTPLILAFKNKQNKVID